MMCQFRLVERRPQQRRPLELVADELGPLGGDDEEADESLVRRDAGVPAQQRLAEHRRPLDLEQEGDLAADVPDAVDLGQVLDGPGRSRRGRRRARGRSRRSPSRPPADPPGLLAPADPDAHAEAVAARRRACASSSVCSWLRRSRSSPVTSRSGVLARLR